MSTVRPEDSVGQGAVPEENGPWLTAWFFDVAGPLWLNRGVAENDLAVERLGDEGQALDLAQRARVTPRQVYVFSVLEALGAPGAGGRAVRLMQGFQRRLLRPDGLYAPSFHRGASDADSPPLLYDQAFGLLGLAAAFAVTANAAWRDAALGLLAALDAHLGADEGFRSSPDAAGERHSNPHMHLFEAFLLWNEQDPSGPWRERADRIGALALGRLADPRTGCVGENFLADWSRHSDGDLDWLEPGHQYEWAWLLCRWARQGGSPVALSAAKTMAAFAEVHGVDPARGVAINRLDRSGNALDRRARLWPQTERLKAGATLFAMTSEPIWEKAALQAVSAIRRYVDASPFAGGWRDCMDLDGAFDREPVSASTLYHLAGAAALASVTGRATPV